jgi:hypothetical protein
LLVFRTVGLVQQENKRWRIALALSLMASHAGCTRSGADAGAGQDAEVDGGYWLGDGRSASTSTVDGGISIIPRTNPAKSFTFVEESGHGLPGCYRCQIAAADFDGDGFVDVVIAGAFDSAFTPDMSEYTFHNVIRVYKNVSRAGGPIRFQLQEEIPDARGGGGAVVVIGDFDGDRVPDFAVQFRDGVPPSSDTAAYLNRGNWIFQRSVLVPGFSTRSTSMGMASGDFDQDGRDELIFNSDGYGSGPGLWYKLDPATGGWTAEQSDFSHRINYGGSIVAGDLNGDHFPDIVVGGNSHMSFGNYDCTETLLYGEIHLNLGQGHPSIDPNALDELGKFALQSDRARPIPCTGMDNAGMMITDVDGDGHNDIIIAGSASGFRGPPGLDKSQYVFVVLFNRDGSGDDYVTFENPGFQYPNGTTNGGSGSVDFPNIAAGDLAGTGQKDVFLQGHHRDYGGDVGSYVFESRLFLNNGDLTFTEVDAHLPNVGEGGQVMADFNNDGRIDLMFTGASIPFHTNGDNPVDHNNASTLLMHVYRNEPGTSAAQ